MACFLIQTGRKQDHKAPKLGFSQAATRSLLFNSAFEDVNSHQRWMIEIHKIYTYVVKWFDRICAIFYMRILIVNKNLI